MSEPKNIVIKNARVNNLKNISLTIPRNQFVVISGVSGSGKSSLAFDTIFAEGQRKYIESLSSYARQFLKRMDKPNVDFIEGLSPAIAVDQKRNNKNPRSTVGTLSEVYDYLKLLYLNIGKTISPISGNVVKKETPDDVLNFLSKYDKEKYAWGSNNQKGGNYVVSEKFCNIRHDAVLDQGLLVKGQWDCDQGF